MQLHKRDVVAKATEILDNYGIADLTMRRLARELDVSPVRCTGTSPTSRNSSVRSPTKCCARAVAATGRDGWRERITDLAGRLRDALLSHTDGAELVSASFAAGQSAAMRRLVDELCGAAADAGLVAGQAELAARTVVYYVLGFTADEQSRLQWDAAGADWPTSSRCCATAMIRTRRSGSA